MNYIIHLQQGNESPGYYVLIEDASTQVTEEDFDFLEPYQDASTQTTDEEFILLEPFREASTQTTEEDFIPLELYQKESTKNIDEDVILLEPTQEANIKTKDEDGDNSMEPTQESSSQKTNGVKLLEQIQPNANTSIAISDRSDDKKEVMIAGSQRHPNPCGTMYLLFPSPINFPREFDMSYGSRHSLVPSGAQCVKRVSIENNPSSKRSKSEIHAQKSNDIITDSKQLVMQYGKVFKLSGEIQIQHGHNDVDPVNSELLSQISNPETSQSHDVLVNDIPKAPGASVIHRKVNRRNFCRYILQFWYQSEKSTEESFTCNVCKKNIHGHSETKKNLYQCCVCPYSTREQKNLLMHSLSHRPKKLCETCGKEYTEGDFHISKHVCKECKETFACRTQLEEHCLNHEDFFPTYCWICSEILTFDDHSTLHKSETLYKCCACEYDTFSRRDFKCHWRNHRPKVFCRICKEEYTFEQNVSHVREYTCIVCEATFQCQTLLGDHYVIHKEHFSKYCRICKDEIENHETKDEFYKCCCCKYEVKCRFYFLIHLFLHTGLKMFKCKFCGKRFSQQKSLGIHLKKCRSFIYACEICGARFASSSDLEMHQLRKISET